MVRRRDPDVLILAPTASGKTEAALLPVLSHVLDHPAMGFRVMIVSPMRALIEDHYRRLFPWEREFGVPIHRLHGDVEASARGRVFRQPAGLLLITPESLESLLIRRYQRLGWLFAGLDFVVLDEVHLMLGTERGAQVRSQLDRLELALNRRVTRIGLSATAGDLDAARHYLRDASVAAVEEKGEAEAMVSVASFASREELAQDVLTRHRNETHLTFTTSKSESELLGDAIRQIDPGAPVLVHHAGLSPSLRREAERRLVSDSAAICVCTSTLEVGIDLPMVNSVTQIGAPASVASLRQRMGRSGRRGGPRRLTVRLVEDIGKHLLDRLDSELVQTLAVLELMAEGWVEPPPPTGRSYSTLVQQILSHLYGNGLTTVDDLDALFLQPGLWHQLTREDLEAILTELARHELLVQSVEGEIALCPAGVERVLSPGFLAAFSASATYQVFSGNEHLGQVMPSRDLLLGDPLILGGHRWQVVQILDEASVIRVRPGKAGGHARFATSNTYTHGVIAQRMRRIYESRRGAPTECERVRRRLAEARRTFRDLGLGRNSVLPDGGCSQLVTWAGSEVNDALVELLRTIDVVAIPVPLGVWSYETPESLRSALGRLDPTAAVRPATTFNKGKFDDLLPRELVIRQAGRASFDFDGAIELARRVVAESDKSG